MPHITFITTSDSNSASEFTALMFGGSEAVTALIGYGTV
jgi:hypothetical protein